MLLTSMSKMILQHLSTKQTQIGHMILINTIKGQDVHQNPSKELAFKKVIRGQQSRNVKSFQRK